MNIFKKWFCGHQWISHAKYNYRDSYFDGSYENGSKEIFICTLCGKIKKVKY